MFISNNENHNLIRRFCGNFFVRPIDRSIDEKIEHRQFAYVVATISIFLKQSQEKHLQ